MIDKKYTDKDIISSLEVIATTCNCNECKIRSGRWGTCNCSETTANAALDLINHQKAEIESLREDLKRVCAERDAHICTNNFIKSEVVKEFAERLKEKSFKSFGNYGITRDVVEVCDIDNLVKEMVGVNTMNDNKEVKVLTHKVIRVDNLMYDGCEPHWKCTRCGKCVPFHCYTKEQFENQECNITDNNKRIKLENGYSFQVEVSNKLEAQIKSEAIKEFADRLKEKSITFYTITGHWVSVKDIDELVKEMVGD